MPCILTCAQSGHAQESAAPSLGAVAVAVAALYIAFGGVDKSAAQDFELPYNVG